MRAVIVAGQQERAQTAVLPFFYIAQIIAKSSSDLFRFVIASEGGSGGHADHEIIGDPLFHHYIDDTGGEDPPHGTAFQYKCCFHFRLLPMMPFLSSDHFSKHSV